MQTKYYKSNNVTSFHIKLAVSAIFYCYSQENQIVLILSTHGYVLIQRSVAKTIFSNNSCVCFAFCAG